MTEAEITWLMKVFKSNYTIIITITTIIKIIGTELSIHKTAAVSLTEVRRQQKLYPQADKLTSTKSTVWLWYMHESGEPWGPQVVS